MRILYTNFHRGPALNGHVTYVMGLARALAGRHHIVVASPAGSGLLRLAQVEPGLTAVAQAFPNRLGQIVGALRQFRRLIVRERIDIIHVNGSGDHRLAILACIGLRPAPRIVYTKHNDLPVSSLTARLRIWGGTHHVIGVCESVRAALAQTPYASVPLTAIPNGVDTLFFDRDVFLAQPAARAEVAAWRRTWAVKAGAAGVGMPKAIADPISDDDIDPVRDMLVLGSQAGTADYKGWLDMVAAVAQLDDDVRARIRIVLAGALPNAAQRETIARSGIADQVHFTGPLDDVRAFVAALDVGFVLSWRETISFACREMMAMGVPAIVSDHGGLPENIDHDRDGWIVGCRDVDAITRCLHHLADHPGDVARVAAAARLRAQSQFGLAPYVAATENVYHQTQCPSRS